MKNFHIATSPLTGTIFAGTTIKNGKMWGSNKKDMTIEALVAVAEHAIHFKEKHGQDITISKPNGQPEFKIIVERCKYGEEVEE